MNNKLSLPIKAQLELQTNLFLSALLNISDEEASFQQNKDSNSIKWIAGHVANTRMTLLSILTGDEQDPTYSRLFGKGTSKLPDQLYPPIEEIIQSWIGNTQKLLEGIGKASEVLLMSKPPFQTSIPDSTLLGLMAFITIHEAHHIGQISMIRKFLAEKFKSDLTLYDRVICN